MSERRGHKEEHHTTKANVSAEESEAIALLASVRRNAVQFRTEIASSSPEEAQKLRKLSSKEYAPVFLQKDASPQELFIKAVQLGKIADREAEDDPQVACYRYAAAARIAHHIDSDTSEYVAKSRECAVRTPNTPIGLNARALLLSVEQLLVQKGVVLPTVHAVAAEVASGNIDMLSDYALVLLEKDRADFLAHIPDEMRREVAILLDASLSTVLHHAVIEQNTNEDRQRKEVRMRVFNEMRILLADGKTSDKKIGAQLARSFRDLGGDVRLLLLELIRDEMDEGAFTKEREQEYLPHVLVALMDNFDDFRVNDIALQLIGDSNTPAAVANYLLSSLLKRGYIPADVGKWWRAHIKKTDTREQKISNREACLVLLQKVAGELGVVPSRDILEFIGDNALWKNVSLDQRVEIIRANQAEFSKANNQRELVGMLVRDEHKAMIYFLLHGGDDRFNLINNYDIGKFKEMLNLIDQLRVHEKPMRQFDQALRGGGVSADGAKQIADRLRAGQFPLNRHDQDVQEASFEVSENAAVKNANSEIGRVLGREQLGVVMLFPMYREYLEAVGDGEAKEWIQKMQNAETFESRLRVIGEVEQAFLDFRKKAENDLNESWRALGEKMVLEMTLEQVFSAAFVPIRGEELLPRLNTKRTDLKRMKKELLVALRGGNTDLKKIQDDIRKKKKAQGALVMGLEKQTDDNKKREIQQKIGEIARDVEDLEKKRFLLSDAKVSERFADLSPEKKSEEIESVGREIIALTEKSPSAIFTYLTMQVLGEDRLREQDIALIQEMESHLQGPFQTIADSLTYQPTGREQKKNQRVVMRYVDKKERLMNMVRFADSKICCFSSNNYEMIVQHDTPNKYWVASINADPMSFVISMEAPQGEATSEGRQQKSAENMGFIFGSFAVDEDGGLGIMLNGIYYAPGIEDSVQVGTILGKVERMFDGLPIKKIAIASQHGGSVKFPLEYVNTPTQMTRLRALDDGRGRPETKLYDDIGTGSSLNIPKTYGGHVWHKAL